MWRAARGPERLLIICGLLLVASGVFHVGVYLSQDGSLAGPVSWRKPIEFGISGGVTTLSLAWVLARLPRTPWLAWPCAVAIALFVPETALIAMQQWRGVPSHFNFDTDFDAAVFSAMGTFIAFVSLGIIAMTVWSFFSGRQPVSTALAIKAGMVLLTVGQVLGFAIVGNGISAGDVFRASIFGAAGEMKLPHAVALHGLQVIGLLALALERSRLPENRRTTLVLAAIAGYAILLAVATLHTFAGRAPGDLTPLTVLGSIAALAVLAGAYLAALRAMDPVAVRSGLSAN